MPKDGQTSIVGSSCYNQYASMRAGGLTMGSRASTPLVVGTVLVMLVVAPLAWIGVQPHSGSSSVGGGEGTKPSNPLLPPRPIPFVPIKVHPLGTPIPATIDPTSYYSSEPAPMGIGDFGVGQAGKPYTYSTPQFLANFSWKSLNIIYGGDSEFTDQLNVVLQFAQGGTTYAYWIQDVAFMNSSSGEIEFENNIWNFTTSSLCLSNSALSGNGTVYTYSGCEGYYAAEAFSQPGADEFMPSPGDFSLLVRSYLSASGVPEVAFEYWDGATSYEVTYDNVVWPWATAVTTDNNFYVDGNATAPSGNFYDAELTLGGPGGGAATAAASGTDASSRLLYWNGHNFEAPRSVWNFGSDTAEAISHVQSLFSHDAAGLPLTTQLNGTVRNATPARAYDQGRVGVLAISAPSDSSGIVSVAGSPWAFQSGQANLTLVPGSYDVWVNSTSVHSHLGRCVVNSGAITRATVPGTCAPEVSTPIGSPGSVDIGEPVHFQATLLGAGSGGDTYDWGSLAAGLGCSPSTSSSIACLPTAAGTYPVAVTVTDSAGQSNTSSTLEFSVDSDPVVGVPAASPASAETGSAIDFTVAPSGGSGGYAYLWSDLPTPCAGADTAAPICHPATPGAYSISVNVTDSNGVSVTSALLSYTVAAGPELTVPTATPRGPIDLSQSVTFSTVATGGVSPYSFAWQDLPTGCSSANASSVSCTPTAAGAWTIAVSVTDTAGGAITSGSVSFRVNAPIEVGSVVALPLDIDLGQNATFEVAGVSGGDGVYSYVWSGLPPGCPALNATMINCVPTETGAFTSNVIVTDSDGTHAGASSHFGVSSDPSVSAIAVSRGSADVGQRVNFSVQNVSGGSGRYSYAWAGLPSGCASVDSATLSCSPSAPGSYSVTATVMDSNNGTGLVRLIYSVYSLPTVATPTASLASGVVGKSIDLFASATLGSGDVRFAWSGLPQGCRSANTSTLTCTPLVNGTYQVIVTVEDSNGGTAISPPLSLLVTPAAAGPSLLAEYAVFALVAGVVAGMALLAVWAVRRRGSV